MLLFWGGWHRGSLSLAEGQADTLSSWQQPQLPPSTDGSCAPHDPALGSWAVRELHMRSCATALAFPQSSTGTTAGSWASPALCCVWVPQLYPTRTSQERATSQDVPLSVHSCAPKCFNQECRHPCSHCCLHHRHRERLPWAPAAVMPTHASAAHAGTSHARQKGSVWAHSVLRESSSFPEATLWQRLQMDADAPILNQPYNHNHILSSDLG